MTCESCQASMPDPCNAVHLRANCDGCRARVLAATGEHVESLEVGSITPRYRAVLERVFGERWKQGHELVKQWGSRIRRVQASAAAATTKP
jgi:hypothetical protein